MNAKIKFGIAKFRLNVSDFKLKLVEQIPAFLVILARVFQIAIAIPLLPFIWIIAKRIEVQEERSALARMVRSKENMLAPN